MSIGVDSRFDAIVIWSVRFYLPLYTIGSIPSLGRYLTSRYFITFQVTIRSFYTYIHLE